tara:strand:+ start:834 stop:1337 length:504 start_codon:yes stop_codon:yes gene_type:complete
MTKILTVENETYDLDFVPEEIEDIRYCVLDYSNPKEADYIFVPLVFLESFNSPAAVLQVGNTHVKIPLDWSLIVCDPMVGDPEVLPVTSLNDRGFKAFVFNPITGFLPSFSPIEIVNIYQEVKWYFPKLKFGHILAVPLSSKKDSPCAYFVKDTNKIPDVLSTEDLW